MQRRRFEHILSFPDRLEKEASRLRAEAEKLPQGSPERGGAHAQSPTDGHGHAHR